jgi:hypothetical protein
MAEKNSLWKNIREKAKKNRASGATPKKPTDEMLRQERKIRAKKYAKGSFVGEDETSILERPLSMPMEGYEWENRPTQKPEPKNTYNNSKSKKEIKPQSKKDWKNDLYLTEQQLQNQTLRKKGTPYNLPKTSEHLQAIGENWFNPNRVNSVGENLIEAVDLTGISSWDDASTSYNSKNPTSFESISNYGSAIPILGKIPQAAKSVLRGWNSINSAWDVSKDNFAEGGYYPTQGPPKALFKGYAEGGEDDRKKRELDKRNDETDAVTREGKQGLGLLAQLSEDFDNTVSPYIPTGNLAKQYYYNNYSPVEYPNPINAAVPVLKTAWNLINPATSIGREQLKAKLTSLSTPNRPIGLDKEGNPNIGEEAWKKALGLPTKEKYIVKSKYKPTTAKDANAEYYTINPNVIDKQKIIDYVKSEDFMKKSSEGKSPNSRVTNMDTFSDFVQDDFIAKEGYKQGIEDYYQIDPIQKFQISKAWDPEKKKWYASIYDKYDFDSKSANKAIKPYEIYDRVYYDSNEKPIVEKQSTASKVAQAYGNPFSKKKADGGYVKQYATGSVVDKEVVLKPRSVYNTETGLTRDFQSSSDGQTWINNDDPTQTIRHQLPEFEVVADFPTQQEYMNAMQKSNPAEYARRLPATGGLEPVYPEMALLPASLPFQATSRLGKAALFAAETQNPLSGFKGSSIKNIGDYEKGLKKIMPEEKYLTGEYKRHAGKELKKAALAFSPSTTKALGRLDDNIAKKMLYDYRFGKYSSVKDFRKSVKQSILESERLKKIHPTLDFGKLDEANSWGLSDAKTLKQYADIQLMVDKSNASQKSFMNYLGKDYNKKMDLINQNETFKNIANESPQYTDIIHEHLKNPKVSDDEFVNNLVKQSNTFTRSLYNPVKTQEEFFTIKGRSLGEGKKNTADVEGFPVSGDYGSFRYKMEPNAERMAEIAATPIEQRWAQRFPENFTNKNENVGFKQGWHTKQSEAYNNWWLKRLNRNRTVNNVPMIKYPSEMPVPHKYINYPQHSIFNSELGDQSIKGFDVSKINIDNPHKYIPGFTRGLAEGGYTNPYNQYQDDPYLQYAYGGYTMYPGGGWKKFGNTVADIGLGIGDVALGAVGSATGIKSMQDIIGTKAYHNDDFDTGANFVGKLAGTALKYIPVTAPFAQAAGVVGGVANTAFGIDKKNYDQSKHQNDLDKAGDIINFAGDVGTMFVNPGKAATAGAQAAGKTQKTIAEAAKAGETIAAPVVDSANKLSSGFKYGQGYNKAVEAANKVSKYGNIAKTVTSVAQPVMQQQQQMQEQKQQQQQKPLSEAPVNTAPLYFSPDANTEYAAITPPTINAGFETPDYNFDQSTLVFSQGGNITNNSLNLRNTMRYKRFAQGGTLEQQGINFITKKAGLHHQNANGGVPIGPDALAEGGEAKLQMADGGQYIVSDQVDGANTQTIDSQTMAERLKKKLKPFMMGGLASNPKDKDALRRPFDSYSAESIAQVKDNAIQETEAVRMQRGGALQYAANGGKLNKDIEKIVMEEYTAAYGGTLPNKYKGKVNMPNSYAKGGIHIKESKKGTFTAAATKHGKSVQEFAKQVLANKENYSPAMVKKANFAHNAAGWNHADGGYVHNQMTQPMYAEGGPIYGDPASEYTYAYGGMYGEPYARGGQIDYTNDMYNSYAGGGPMPSNLPQAFNGPAAQNKNGMYIYPDGGMMPPEQQMMQEQQMQQQQAPQEQMQQQGGQEQMMQMVQQIAEAIMGGAQPEQIMAKLEGSGMPPEQIQQVMQVAMQIVDQQQGQQPMQGQEQQMPPQQGMSTGGRLPKDILRARAEAHMSPEKAASYVDNYAMGGKMYYEGGPSDPPYKTNLSPTVYSEQYYDPNAQRGYDLSNILFDNIVGDKNYNVNYSPDNNNSNIRWTSNKPSNLTGWGTPTQTNQSIPGPYQPATVKNLNRLKTAHFNDELGYPDLTNKQLGAVSMSPDMSIYNEDYVPGVDADGRPVSWNPAILDDYNKTTGAKIQVNPNTLGEDWTNTKQQTSPANATNPGGSEGMSAADWGTMIGQLAGPAHQFFQPKPKPFQYQKGKPTTLNPATAIMLANQASREAQATADYNIKQNAPTSGSYLANMRANASEAGRKRGLTAAGITQQYDINNAGILNQFEQYNTDLENRAIDANQQDEANWQTQRTNALYNAGTNMAGMRKDYKANQINETIAKNLGTNNWQYDPATETIKFRTTSGQMISVPAATVLGTNSTNLGTGEMQQAGTPQFQSNFDAKTNQAFRNKFKGSNSGK